MMLPTDFAEQLKWKQRAIDLMLALDRVRDRALDEREMTLAFVTTLAEAVEAELCLLCVRDVQSDGEPQLRAVVDRLALWNDATQPVLLELATRALKLSGAAFLEADLPLTERGPARVSCLAAPLHAAQETLGALLLLNVGRAFSAEEKTLVSDAISQIDSALRQMRTLRELERRKLELETIFRIDHIRDEELDFQTMLNTVLTEVCRVTEAETGFIMLFDRQGNELEMRAATDQSLFGQEAVARHIRAAAEQALQSAQPVVRTYAGQPLRALLGMPLILDNRLIGVLGVINRRGRPDFSRDDLELLRAISSQMDTAIFEGLETQKLRNAFGQCVGPQVMKRLLSISGRDLLSGERIEVTTLFSDIRGFTNMSEQLEPEVLQHIINDHLSALTDLVLAHEGTLDKYIGDGLMAVFNAPERQPEHAWRAVRLAQEMHQAHHAVMARWEGRVPLPPIGIGIATGETIMGNFGSVRRLEYTGIGKPVNLAARLCAAALGDQTLISDSTYRLVRDQVVADELAPLHLKGIEAGVRCWDVRALR